MKILIKRGRVIDPSTNTDAVLDIYINGNVIEKVDRNITVRTGDTQTINASGNIVAPGFIDMHTHLREPGYEWKETIKTGTMAAVKGGFTSVVCMANTLPVNDNRSVTESIIEKARLEGTCRVFPCGSITKGLKGEELSEIGEMVRAGIIAVSDDGRSVENAGLLRKAMEYTKIFDIPVISHCEDDDLSKGFVNEGHASLLTGLNAVPSVAEEIIVKRDMTLARYVDSHVHLTHISVRGSVDAIRHDKKRHKHVSCDTCPHYFTLNDESTLAFDTNTKVNPPLRSKDDVEAIRAGLKNGTIDVIATDHAPHDSTSKDVEYDIASSGISGLETALPLSLALVRDGVLSLMEMIRKLTANPARILRLPYGTLAPGKSADIIIFNPDALWVVDTSAFVSKGKNTPFQGWEMQGKNLLTIVDGRIVYRDEGLC